MLKTVQSILKKNYFLLTSLLMFLSFPSYDILIFKAFPLFAWIAFVPLFVYIRNKSLKDVYYYAFITSLIGNFLCYHWIGQFGASVPGGSAVILILLMPLLSMYFGLKIILAEFLSRRYEKLRLVIFPAVWICIDWMQSIGHLAFPWPIMAYSQYPLTWFIQSAAIIGAQGITFIIILVNYSISALVMKYISYISGGLVLKNIFKTKEACIVYCQILLIIIISVIGIYIIPTPKEYTQGDLRVSLIQSCISPWDNWRKNRFKYLDELKTITNQAVTLKPDLIIWSESATLDTISYNFDSGIYDEFTHDLLDYAGIINIPLVSGEIGIIEDFSGNFPIRYPLNSAVYINREGDVIGSYAKIHLVPFGEWFPYEKWFPIVKDIQRGFGGSDFVPGDEEKLFSINQYKFCILICYEGIFNRLCRSYKKMGAQFFVNITNDGWTDSYSGHMQHFAASIFRAIENGMWYVRAGNTGYSTLIDPYGRITQSMPILEKGSVTGDLDLSLNRETFYSSYGDVVLYLSMALIVCLLFISAVLLCISLRKRIMLR